MSAAGHGVAHWSSAGWLAEANRWIDDGLAAAGLARAGEAEQPSLRPWATVLRVPTTDGAVWMKATGPEVAFEAGVYALLQQVAPDRVLTPLAVDVERGWLLLPDGGPTLGARFEGPELVDALAEALPHYARLQRALAPHVDELLALGVADMRPERMPARFDEALAAVGPVDGVAEMRDTVVGWCARLSAGPIPASIDHNDLHAWNVLDGARFYDWGDAVVAHPFASMLALGWVRMDEADLLRLRDAYLEPFADLAPHAELVEQLELACRAGKIARALTWHRAIATAAPGDLDDDDWDDGPAASLRSLLEDTWLGRV